MFLFLLFYSREHFNFMSDRTVGFSFKIISLQNVYIFSNKVSILFSLFVLRLSVSPLSIKNL